MGPVLRELTPQDPSAHTKNRGLNFGTRNCELTKTPFGVMEGLIRWGCGRRGHEQIAPVRYRTEGCTLWRSSERRCIEGLTLPTVIPGGTSQPVWAKRVRIPSRFTGGGLLAERSVGGKTSPVRKHSSARNGAVPKARGAQKAPSKGTF